jgi:hypothetical protein
VNNGNNADVPTDSYDLNNNADMGEPHPYDIDNEARIQDGIVDTGADEVDVCTFSALPYTVPAGDTVALIMAITCANASSDENIINLTNGIYTFTSVNNSVELDGGNALPIITTPITINGSGVIFQPDASAPAFRLIYVNSSGLYNEGTTTITNSTISGNSVTGNGSSGGDINNGMDNSIIIKNSTISDNTAFSRAGGIANSGTLALINSSLTGNSTDGQGGGIFHATSTKSVSYFSHSSA